MLLQVSFSPLLYPPAPYDTIRVLSRTLSTSCAAPRERNSAWHRLEPRDVSRTRLWSTDTSMQRTCGRENHDTLVAEAALINIAAAFAYDIVIATDAAPLRFEP